MLVFLWKSWNFKKICARIKEICSVRSETMDPNVFDVLNLMKAMFFQCWHVKYRSILKMWIRTSQKSSFSSEKWPPNFSKLVIALQRINKIIISDKSFVQFSAKHVQKLKKRVHQSTKIRSKNHQHCHFFQTSKFT